MPAFSKVTKDKYIKEVEERGEIGITRDDYLGDAKRELILAQEKVNFIEYYMNHACPYCNKLMRYHGNELYQCQECRYTEIVKAIISDE